MNNGDMPAMPISVTQGPSGDVLTTDDYGVGMGLSKREHFAAMAMQGLLSNARHTENDCNLIDMIPGCVELADALLVALEDES